MERRRKATLPAVLGTPEHCGLIRRDLVVCPPFWLLPRIETGDSFLWACCAPLLRLHPQGNVPAWAFAGRTFRRLWGMSVPSSLSAPLLCQIIVAILCGNFEQFANKRPAGRRAGRAVPPCTSTAETFTKSRAPAPAQGIRLRYKRSTMPRKFTMPNASEVPSSSLYFCATSCCCVTASPAAPPSSISAAVPASSRSALTFLLRVLHFLPA